MQQECQIPFFGSWKLQFHREEKIITLAELNQQAFKTLMDSLGYVNTVRFFKQFDLGSGDYSNDRRQWLDNLTIDDIWADIQQRQTD